MAFKDVEKTDIVTYLNYPGLTVVPDSIHYVNWIDDRLSTTNKFIESRARALLERIKGIDVKLEKALCQLGMEKVDNVTFNENVMDLLRKERKKLLKELAHILDIPPIGLGSMGSVCV